MEPEILFLKYAFPCAFISRQKGKITNSDYHILEDAAVNNKVVLREFLKKVFPDALGGMQVTAEELNKDIWDLDVIEEYFIVRHNKLIDKGMYPDLKLPTLEDLCRVQKAKVISIKDGILVVEYDGKRKRPVLKNLIQDARIGDHVYIHYGYAVKKL